MAAQPLCPSCKVVGKKHIANTPSDQKAPGGMAKFEVLHCDQCGYVYSVLSNLIVQV